MFVYHYRIFEKHEHKIAHLAILTDEDRRWRPSKFGYNMFGTELVLKFRTVKLLDYADEWETFATNKNPFAMEKLEQLSEALLEFNSAKDLNKWLRENAPARRKRKAQ